MANKPLVSICMITYGHEKFIRQAINGVLMQQCNFDFELVLSNDASPDQSDSIIRDILEQHPQAHRIKYVCLKKNIGMQANFIQALQRCTGNYIALCDGDDYWTDPLKLQLQADFMESNPDLRFCFHKALKLIGPEEKPGGLYPGNVPATVIGAIDFFKITTIPTASVFYKNDFSFPELPHSHPDFLLYCSLLTQGNAGFLDREMSVYRRHDGGISALYGSERYMENRINELITEKDYPKFSKLVREQIKKILTDHILFYLSDNRNTLGLIEKMHYLKVLFGLQWFYRQPFKTHLRVMKIFLR